MQKIKDFCAKNTAYTARWQTDKLFPLPQHSAVYSGLLDNAIKYIESFQLLNEEYWDLFAEQFKSATDDNDAGWRCEYWGKMMRGAAFTYTYTKNEKLYDMMTKTVRDLLTTQDDLGRISTYSVEKEFDGWDIWGRKYVLLGLQYYYEICKDETLKQNIVNSMCRQADYIISKIGNSSEGKKNILEATRHWEGLNSSSLLEPIVRLYSMTGYVRFLNFSTYIISCGATSSQNIFNLAYEGKLHPYEYNITKAYEMMSCFEGLLEYYRVTGIEKWRTAVVNIWDLIKDSDITIIGSAGCTHELFDHSKIRQFDPEFEGIMQETCVTVTWMKFSYQLLCLTGDSKYADAIEISAYNGLLGSINTNQITTEELLPFDSYSPLRSSLRGRVIGGRRQFANGKIYGCCAAIGAAGTGLIPMASAMNSKTGFALILYQNGNFTANTPENQDCKITMTTNYPKEELVDIKLSLNKDEKFNIFIRIPSWCENASAEVNGEVVIAKSGSFLNLDRTWKDGDNILLKFPMQIKLLKAIDINPDSSDEARDHIALLRGPIVLARDESFNEEDFDHKIKIKTDINNIVNENKSSDAEFITEQEYKIPLTNGQYITVVDYASAGKKWDKNIACWIKATY